MTTTGCECLSSPCDCCTGIEAITPLPIYNRPGLPALSYRAGTHASFLKTMKARLSTREVERGGSVDAQAGTLRPLASLTVRDADDPTIALLDAWATVADVLTFYDERIANECYLGTATERRSVLELSRLIGYELRPGVAATAYLAYSIDDNQSTPVTIAAGARSQSTPGPGETAQTFETSDELEARREWNNLQPRLRQPQVIALGNVLSIKSIRVAGVTAQLKPGDKLLFVFEERGAASVVRSVASTAVHAEDSSTLVSLKPIAAQVLVSLPLLVAAIAKIKGKTGNGRDEAIERAEAIRSQAQLGVVSNPLDWASSLESEGTSGDVQTTIDVLGTDIAAAIAALPGSSAVVTSPNAFVNGLLALPAAHPRNSLRLQRNLADAFGIGQRSLESATNDIARDYSDVGTQLLVGTTPALAQTYYAAWEGAQLNPAQSPLLGVFALRTRATLFGATAPKLPKYSTGGTNVPGTTPAGQLLPLSAWDDWSYANDEDLDNAFIDQANDAITPGSYALIDIAGVRQARRIMHATVGPRSAYGLSGPSTQLVFDIPEESGWRTTSDDISNELRQTQLYLQSEPLSLVDERIEAPVGGSEIELDRVYKDLKSGRWVVISGERADIAGVSGVRSSELLMITGLRHGFDPERPGDQLHTTLLLASAPSYQYKRSTAVIHGNVVKATQGETRFEPLGSGDGAQSLQSFTLKQPPLTFVAAPTDAGAASTLHVRVNDIEWHEASSLAFLGPKDRGFATRTDDAGGTTLTFGNGVHGARLPTGVQNVGAVYRNGLGKGGNVKPEQINLLHTRPLGVRGVLNPLHASGGADKETRDLGRETAPLSVMPLDRLVSVQDYADFARVFAGIAKADACVARDAKRQLIHLTIAGVDDIPIDTSSDLYLNLLAALRRCGDADLPLQLDARERKTLVVSARIKLLPDYAWESVATAARACLLDTFGFHSRRLGQPALLCEVIAAIQNLRGVAYVDVDTFGAVPEKVTTSNGRSLLTQDEVAQAILSLVSASNTTTRLPADVTAWPGGLDDEDGDGEGVLRPAEIAILVPEIPDTIILNQIL